MKFVKTHNLLAVSALLIFLHSGGSQAEEAVFLLSGSVKTYFYSLGPAAFSSGGQIWNTPLRLRLFFQPDESFSLEAADEASLGIQSGGSGASPFLPPAPSYRVADFPNPAAGPSQGEGTRVLNNLDRLSVNFHWDKWDLTLGRQVVSFGSARVVNPIDVIAPYNIQVLNQEYRSGVDAARLRYAWDAYGELDLGWVAGKDALGAQSAAFARSKFRLGGSDLSVLGMIFQKNLLAGLDLQSSIGGAGIWVEAALVKTDVPDGAYSRVSLGCDYSFTGELYGFLEYHFNGAGREDSADYLRFSNQAAYGAGTVYLLGRHYLAPSLSWQADPLISLGAQALFNLTDGSFWILAQAEYNLFENWYLEAGLAQPAGEGLSGLAPRSEFGLYPSFQFASFRTYF